MKSVKVKKFNIDPLAEIKKSKNYSTYAKDADDRIKLATVVYNKRVNLGLSQQKLAKLVRTTQKVISNIENAEVNLGLDLMNRIGKVLQFQEEDWAQIHNFIIPSFIAPIKLSFSAAETNKQIGNAGASKQKILNMENEFIN